eukprot:GAHX01000607.1.p1 GENE.GAHX01000607.1~~GAHX01000607.1.p1  ORF type:complete len:1232 (-),score=279.39 GAHX01000607.1:486-4181(-)
MNTPSIDLQTIERFAEIKYTQPDSSEISKANETLGLLLKNKSYLSIALEVLQTSSNNFALMIAASTATHLFTSFHIEIASETAFTYAESILTLIVTKSFPYFIQNMLIAIPVRILKLYLLKDKERSIILNKLLVDKLKESLEQLKANLTNPSEIIPKINVFSNILAELIKEMSTPIVNIKASLNKKTTSNFKENYLLPIFTVQNEMFALINNLIVNNIKFPFEELLQNALLILKNIINYDFINTFMSETVDNSNMSLHVPLFFQSLILPGEELEKTEGFDLVLVLSNISNYLFMNEENSVDLYRFLNGITECLCRLAQVRRVIFPSETVRNSYLSKNMLACLLLIQNVSKIDKSDVAENVDLQDFMHKIFEFMFSIKSNYPMSELLNIPFFWVYLDKSIEYSQYCLVSIPFNDERFQFLLKYWSKVANVVHYLYSANTSSLLTISDTLNNILSGKEMAQENLFVSNNIRNPVYRFKEYGLMPIKNINISAEDYSAREIVTSCLMNISKCIIEAMVNSVDYAVDINEVDFTFPHKGNVHISKHLPAIIKTHGAQAMLENLITISSTLCDEYIKLISGNKEYNKIELKLAKIVEVISTLATSNSYYIDGHDGESINKDGFVLISTILLKVIILIENRLKGDKSLQTLRFLDLNLVKLIKCFSTNFFDSNSPLNYYNKLTLDMAFFEKLSTQLGPYLQYALEIERPVKIDAMYQVTHQPMGQTLDVYHLEGLLIRKTLTNLKIYNDTSSIPLLKSSILALDSILTSDIETDKLDFLKKPKDGVLNGKLKYVNQLILFDVSEMAFLKNNDKSVLKVIKRLFELMGLLLFSKFGISYFKSIISPIDKLLDKLNTVTNEGQELDNEIKRNVFIISYALRGVICSFNTYDHFALFIRWFTSKNNSILLRTLETYSNDGNISSAVIKFYCDLSSVDNVPVGNTLILSTIGGGLPSDKLILSIFKDVTKIVLILSNKLNLLQPNEENLSVTKYKPLCLAVKLLTSTVSCEFISFGAMSFYNDNSLYKCLSSILQVVLSSPLIDLISHQKLFFYIIKLTYKLIRKHMDIIVEFDFNLLSPMLSLILEALQMPDKRSRVYASKAVTNLLEYRYKEFLNPVWDKDSNAITIDKHLNENSETIIQIFEAMFDNMVVGNQDNFPEFIDPIFLIIVNYNTVFSRYKDKIIGSKENEHVRAEINDIFNSLINKLELDSIDAEALEDFKLIMDTFTLSVGKLSIKTSE